MVAQLVDALDVFPADAVGRHRVLGRRGAFVLRGGQGADDVFDIGRLGEVVDRAGLHGGDGGGDGAVAGEDHRAGIGAGLLEDFDDFQAAAIFEAQVQHGEGGRVEAGDVLAFGDGGDRRDDKAALGEGPGEALHEGAVIVHDETGLVLERFEAGVHVHGGWAVHRTGS